MAEITVTVEGADRLYKKLGLDILKVIEPAIDASGHRVEGKFKVYPPPPPPGLWAANTSPRQKAAFFAKLGRGEGGRTGQYGGAWMTTISRGNASVTAEINNPTQYAGWVGSESMQARFHRGRWPTDVKLLEAEMPNVLEDVQQRVIAAYGGD